MAFRTFAKNKDLRCDDLTGYLSDNALESEYFVCVNEVIEKVCNDIIKFPAKFDECNV